VGETSGDLLGADLLLAIKRIIKNPFQVEGICGPQSMRAGAHTLFPMERLSVMGLWEPLSRLPELYSMQQAIIKHFIKQPPELFIGIDAPDFNLSIEQALRAKGIKTVHYVSPSVWAWRPWRIHKIKKAVSLMLTLFPFEAKYYEAHQIPVCCVGHPFADQIPLRIDIDAAKESLHFSFHQTIVALMPGSRMSELKYLGPLFLQTAAWMHAREPAMQFAIPLVNEKHAVFMKALCEQYAPHVPITIIVGRTRAVISASDAVLVTSGTATLEVMLHKKPMVVAYKMHPITYQIAKRMVKVPYISLPNLLANEKIVPEFIQQDIHISTLGETLFKQLELTTETAGMLQKFTELHQVLQQDASFKAAEAINRLLRQ